MKRLPKRAGSSALWPRSSHSRWISRCLTPVPHATAPAWLQRCRETVAAEVQDPAARENASHQRVRRHDGPHLQIAQSRAQAQPVARGELAAALPHCTARTPIHHHVTITERLTGRHCHARGLPERWVLRCDLAHTWPGDLRLLDRQTCASTRKMQQRTPSGQQHSNCWAREPVVHNCAAGPPG